MVGWVMVLESDVRKELEKVLETRSRCVLVAPVRELLIHNHYALAGLEMVREIHNHVF